MGVYREYDVYLESAEFAEFREKVFERDGHTCITCGSQNNLQVHHLTYLHVYHENLDELVCVCRKCHEIFHNLDNRKRYIEEKYRNEIIEARKQEYKEKDKVRQEVIAEVKRRYADADYAKNGTVDMCDWKNLNPIIQAVCEDLGYDSYPPKQELQQWFFYRRCELFLRCLDKGLSIDTVEKKTLFTRRYLEKWYKRELLEAKLNEEKFINNL